MKGGMIQTRVVVQTAARSLRGLYSVVTDLALEKRQSSAPTTSLETNSQVPGEVDVKSILYGQVVAQELQGDDIE